MKDVRGREFRKVKLTVTLPVSEEAWRDQLGVRVSLLNQAYHQATHQD